MGASPTTHESTPMATMMKPDPAMAAGPAESPAAEAAEGMEAPAPGYTIAIRVGADGKLSVGVERESAEDVAEEYAGFEQMPDIKAALTRLLEIYKADGEVPEAADAQFDAGFASRGGMQG